MNKPKSINPITSRQFTLLLPGGGASRISGGAGGVTGCFKIFSTLGGGW